MASLPSPTSRFRHQYPYWLPPALVAFILTLIYLNPFIGDWDGLDYTIFSLHARPSSMALGRSLFTLFNFALYKFAHAIFQVQRQHAYLLFKYAVVIETPLAVIVCWLLARDLTGSVRAATLAALMIACSPILVIYGGQVMTEIPSVLFTAIALAVHLRGIQQKRLTLILAGAALLGLGVNLRETVGLYAAWLLFAPFVAGYKFKFGAPAGSESNLRNLPSLTVGLLTVASSLVIFLVVALGPFAIWYASSTVFRLDWHTWLSSMQDEAQRHPISAASLKPFLIYFFMCAPLITV